MVKTLAALFAVIAMFLSTPTHAAMQASDESGTTVTLSLDPCTNPAALEKSGEVFPVLAAQGAVLSPLHAGSLVYQGKVLNTCWFLVNGEMVGVIVDDGEATVFPMPVGAFRNVEGI